MQSKVVSNFIKKHIGDQRALNGLAEILSGESSEWVIDLALREYERSLAQGLDEAKLNSPADVLAHLDPIDEPAFPHIPIRREKEKAVEPVAPQKVLKHPSRKEADAKRYMLGKIKKAHEKLEVAIGRNDAAESISRLESIRNDLIGQFQRIYKENVTL